jgi:hypothetical protein
MLSDRSMKKINNMCTINISPEEISIPYHYQVLVHSPYDYATVESKGVALGTGTVAFIGVGASLTESTENVQG